MDAADIGKALEVLEEFSRPSLRERMDSLLADSKQTIEQLRELLDQLSSLSERVWGAHSSSLTKVRAALDQIRAGRGSGDAESAIVDEVINGKLLTIESGLVGGWSDVLAVSNKLQLDALRLFQKYANPLFHPDYLAHAEFEQKAKLIAGAGVQAVGLFPPFGEFVAAYSLIEMSREWEKTEGSLEDHLRSIMLLLLVYQLSLFAKDVGLARAREFVEKATADLEKQIFQLTQYGIWVDDAMMEHARLLQRYAADA